MSESQLLFELNRFILRTITTNIIKQLQEMTDKSMLLSGEDSGLTNVWEEYCVQIQGEESFFFGAYQSVIEQCIENELNKHPIEVKKIISYAGSLSMDEIADEDIYEYNEDAAIQEILSEVKSVAYDFTNDNIERYLFDQ